MPIPNDLGPYLTLTHKTIQTYNEKTLSAFERERDAFLCGTHCIFDVNVSLMNFQSLVHMARPVYEGGKTNKYMKLLVLLKKVSPFSFKRSC